LAKKKQSTKATRIAISARISRPRSSTQMVEQRRL
jgi:hypothetical protein